MERKVILLTAIAGGLALGAFSRPVRQKIIERDRFRCRVCGSSEHLEAAHKDHNRNNPRYNHPSNGITLCLDDHIKDHIERAGKNGLPPKANEWAISIMMKKKDDLDKHGLIFSSGDSD